MFSSRVLVSLVVVALACVAGVAAQDDMVDAVLVESLSQSFAGQAAALNAQSAVELPALGKNCMAFGAKGTCKKVAACEAAKSYAYYGFCAGDATIKCCVPAVKNSVYNARQLAVLKASAAARAAEAESQAKWTRFKQLHNKQFSSADVEAQRYAVFKRNRMQIIAANDQAGAGVAIWRSTSPYADVDPAVFAARMTNLRAPSSAASFLEINDVLNAYDNPLFHQSGEEEMDVNMLEAEATVDAEVEAELDAEIESEAEAEVDAEAEAESETETEVDAGADAEAEDQVLAEVGQSCFGGGKAGMCGPVATCKGAAYSGQCAGAANIKCCVPFASPSPAPAPAPTPAPAPGEQKRDLYPVAPKEEWTSPWLRKVKGVLEVDHRNIMSPFKNQKQCGSCWAFAGTATYESAGVRAGLWDNTKVFSPQQLVSCATSDKHYGFGCSGGDPSAAFRYYQEFNATLESSMPYKEAATTCPTEQAAAGPKLAAYGYVRCRPGSTKADGTVQVCPDNDVLKSALKKYGPMLVAVDAGFWQNYEGGIFPTSQCRGKINHAVQLVGYGSETINNVAYPFWLIRNSWGATWGEQGYIRVAASNDAFSGCSVQHSPIYANF